MIDEFFHFVMYNAINNGIDKTICYVCWLIIEMIVFLLGHEWDKVCIFFIDV